MDSSTHPETHLLRRTVRRRTRRLLAKPRSKMEVINDLNGDLITFYRCVRFHQDVLLTELEFVLNSRKEFFDFRDQPGLTDIQRAARWFFRNKNCFRGMDMDTLSTSPTTPSGILSSRHARMETIRALSLRLDRVGIEHLEWQDCVRLYDRPTTFFFLDPPYTECKTGIYGTWTNTDVQRLRDRLGTIKGKWLVTLNDSQAVRAIFAGCRFTPIARAKTINGSATYRELVIQPK